MRYTMQEFTNSMTAQSVRNKATQQFAKWLTYNSVLEMSRCNLLATMIIEIVSPVANSVWQPWWQFVSLPT